MRRNPQSRKARLFVQPLESRLVPAFAEFVNPDPTAGDAFGSFVVPLANGNVVIASPNDDVGGSNVGAVYLFNGKTGALISTLRGSSPDDTVGSGGITALPSGNFVVRSLGWDNPFTGAVNAGAVTFVNGETGLNGVVSSTNSLVGASSGDQIGNFGIVVLTNGNYLVRSPDFDFFGAVDSGALTWGSGDKGISGLVSATTSLVSAVANSNLGQSSISELTNGNYIARTPSWDNGAADSAGAVTWGNGTTGVRGIISAANSLVGTTSADAVGNTVPTLLPNGDYVVVTTVWNNGATANVGAVTHCNGATGRTGPVGPANSLIGSTASDLVGNSGITVLPNGNYLVRSSAWNNGASILAGALTFVNGNTGLTGAVSAANSLVGTTSSDVVGNNAPVVLLNGNYVLRTPTWNNGATVDAGAVTWGSGASGITGAVSAANSLVGTTGSDNVGQSVVALPNGNYVAFTTVWNNGATADVGAVTLCNGNTGLVGAVSAANSLIGSTTGDQVGSGGISVLDNSNFVVTSLAWNNGAVVDAGAVTFVNGVTGLTAVVSPGNSLVGSTNNDQVGFNPIITLANGNYVVRSPVWDNGVLPDVGAVTWGSGTVGVTGAITLGNSLIGSSANDQIGGSITELTNGNYVVNSPSWDNGGIVDAGAATWRSGTGGVGGQITAANSLVGSTAMDQVGSVSSVALPSGNYLVRSPSWDNGAAVNAGAVTWGSGTAGVSGVISAANSLVGSGTSDQVGNSGITVLPNGNFVVRSAAWQGAAGAVTWGSGATGISGVVSAANSLVGSINNDSVGSSTVVVLASGNYVVPSPSWDNGGIGDAGAATWGDGATGVSGVISAAKSLVGTSTGDSIGVIATLSNGDYLVISATWNNGAVVDAGMISWGDGNSGVRGVVSSANALVGIGSSAGLSVSPIVDPVNDTFIARFTSEQFGGRVRFGSLSSGIIPTLSTVYVDDGFAAPAGTTIADADPGSAGSQPAIVGESAFRTIPEALSHLVDGGTLILNAGTYPEDVAMTRDFTWKPTQGIATVTGIVSGPFGVIKDGGGVLALSGVNTFTGDVEIRRGFLRANSDASLGNANNAVIATGLGGLNVTGSFTTSRTFEFGASSLVIDSGKTLTYASAAMNGGFLGGPGIFAAASANISNATFNSSVTVSTNGSTFGACTFHGPVNVLTATSTFNQCAVTPSGQFTVTSTANLSHFESTGQITVAGTMTNTGGLTTLGGGSITTINSGATFDVGAFGARVAGGLVKNSGTFGSGAGTITVDYNGRVQGAGTFGSVVTQNGGVFAPGSSPGTATTNQFNLNGGGLLEFEVANATGTPGNVSGWDLVNVQPTSFSATGLMNYTATPASKYIIQLKSRLDDMIGNTPGNAANFNPAVNFAWKFSDGSNVATSSIGTFDPTAFQIDTTGFSNSFTGSFGVELRDGGKNLYVVYTKPTVTSLVVNNGNVQRSRLTTMQVNFSAPVNAAALGSMTLTRTAGIPLGTVVQTGAVGANGRILVSPASGSVTSVALTFDNADASNITAGVEFGSLSDGRWQLAIPNAGFTSVLNDLDLHRLFGDADGDGTVAANDFIQFRLALEPVMHFAVPVGRA